jgi:hypothetical protein
MTENQFRQEIIDGEHLKLLSVFHYIQGALTILTSSFFILHLVMFAIFSKLAESPEFAGDEFGSEFPFAIFTVLTILFGVFILLGITFGILQIISGISIKKRKNRIFSFIIAILELIFIPYGTILGVLTIIVLQRDSVNNLYEQTEGTA